MAKKTSSMSGEHKLELDKAIQKNKNLIQNGQKMVEKASESVPPDVDQEDIPTGDRQSQTGIEIAAVEVKEASQTLKESVEELKLPMLLAVGMLEKVLVWLKLTTIIGILTLIVMIYAAIKITMAASVSARTNQTQIELTQKLEEKLKVSPKQILDQINKKDVEEKAEEEIAAAEQPTIEADEHGKVAIVVPQRLSPEKKQEIRKRAVGAEQEDNHPPVKTRAVRIEVDLERKKVTDINQQEIVPQAQSAQ
ncbi:MAG TPA: hypothetical protein ENO13_01320 [Candidatus Bathyarchaeota archaeon]|nr:hypothetical protein [Candidatus Bathyarchaeota archaeon]